MAPGLLPTARRNAVTLASPLSRRLLHKTSKIAPLRFESNDRTAGLHKTRHGHRKCPDIGADIDCDVARPQKLAEKVDFPFGIFAVDVKRPSDIGIIEQVHELAVAAILGSRLHPARTLLRILPMKAPPSFLMQEATALHREGQLVEAAARYEQVLAQEKRNADAMFLLATVQCQQGRLSDGIETARKAIKTNPKYAPAYNLMGVAQQQLGRTELALNSFDRAVAADPKFAEAWFNRALNLLNARPARPCDRELRPLDRAPARPRARAAWPRHRADAGRSQ